MKRILALVMAACMIFTGFAFAEEETADTYTYNMAISEFPTVWDPLRQQTNTDSTYTSYLGNGLYDFEYNEDMDGFVIVPLAAADMPVDVTADYVGEQWGIEEGETSRAWKIALREDMTWEDGTPITAKDFVDSAKLRLNPLAANYRADSFYIGNLVITNAEAYAKSGVESTSSIASYMAATGAEDVESMLAASEELMGYINWANSFGDTYDFESGEWTGDAEDAIVETPLTIAELYSFYTEGAGLEYATWADAETMQGWALDELFVSTVGAECTWESVGYLQTGDYEITLILTKPLEGFYLLYSLGDTQLVKADVYEACTTIEDGVYTCTYGTTLETSPSWGPYKMTEFQSDKLIVLERNDAWFGFNDNPDVYQATHLQWDYVAEPATRLEMFLNGQLDTFGLSKDYMDEYASSDYTYYNEGDSVFAMAFNPDLAAMRTAQAAAGENINKTIVTIKDFRIAMSLAMDRAAFCLATSPTNAPAFALYGSQIVADPDNGIFYRTTDVAKQVIVDFWGLTDEIGEGKLYADADEAIDSITGYNLEMAKTYFDAAYDQAIAEGLMDEDDVIQICVGTPNNTHPFYNNGYDFIVNNYTEAVVGTKLEGKLTFTRDDTLGNGFANALRNNQVDMLFGVGWTGSTFDPYGLMEAYTSNDNQYDPAWDTTVATLDITLGEETYTATVYDWTMAISGEVVTGTNAAGEEVELCFPYSTDETEAAYRFQILGELENTVLQNYDFIPLMGDSDANLKGMQIEYYTEDEVFPMGRGGVKYMTFNYTDAEWDAFVADQGGTLNYK